MNSPLVRRLFELVMIAVLAAMLLALLGCDGPAPPPKENVFAEEEPVEAVLCVGLDVSGSFYDKMFGADGRAYRYIAAGLEKYFRAMAQTRCRIVIFQISGTGKAALLWDGGPQAFREQFRSGAALRSFVMERYSPAGSAIFDGIADCLDYVCDMYPDGKEGRPCRIVTLALTDMEESSPDPAASEARLLRSLSAYGKRGGALGLFWVNHGVVPKWKRHLQEAGVKKSVVYSEIVADPGLPDWEN